jgi:hypothetical protein
VLHLDETAILLDLNHKAEGWIPITIEDKAAIREQLEQLLQDRRFSHSKRYPSFLRFVVAYVLKKEDETLKERTIGVEVFGRPLDYDTNTDPIVRVTAVEIRKRISNYYEDPAHTNELWIELPSGSYLPYFHSPDFAVSKDTRTDNALIPEPPTETLSPSQGIQ